MKTRYAKPFESLQIKIPYTTGMNPFSGLVDLFEKKNILKKDGNRLKYVATDGTEIKLYRKEWESNTNDSLLRAMNEFTDVPVVFDDIEDIIEDDYVMEDDNNVE
jgi:hypothetical protein